MRQNLHICVLLMKTQLCRQVASSEHMHVVWVHDCTSALAADRALLVGIRLHQVVHCYASRAREVKGSLEAARVVLVSFPCLLIVLPPLRPATQPRGCLFMEAFLTHLC